MTLTIGPAITIRGGGNQGYSARIGYSSYFGGGSNTSIINQGTISAGPGRDGHHRLPQRHLHQPGNVAGKQRRNALGQWLCCRRGGRCVQVGQLLNRLYQRQHCRRHDQHIAFAPAGTTILNGGTAVSPRFLEVMGRDLGSVAAGFSHNFVYGTLAIGNGTYGKLVDQSLNTTSASPRGGLRRLRDRTGRMHVGS